MILLSSDAYTPEHTYPTLLIDARIPLSTLGAPDAHSRLSLIPGETINVVGWYERSLGRCASIDSVNRSHPDRSPLMRAWGFQQILRANEGARANELVLEAIHLSKV
jgi:hypothetical protein